MNAQAQDPYLQLALEFGGESIGFNFIDSKFNVEFANALAEIEAYNKHLYRPNTYLHKWWARRCGTTFRAILKHLVRDQAKQDFYAPGGLEGQIILDPMMGGGTTSPREPWRQLVCSSPISSPEVRAAGSDSLGMAAAAGSGSAASAASLCRAGPSASRRP